MSVLKIVLTGGPCAGKTTILKMIEEEFRENFIVVPEIASVVIRPKEEGGLGVPGFDVEMDQLQEWLNCVQPIIAGKQIEQEEMIVRSAEQRNENTVVVCDRGLLDCAAYLEGGREKFLEMAELDLEYCFSLYDMVIHLQSLAVSNPELYSKHKESNPSRIEDVGRAAMLDQKVLEAYLGHPNLVEARGQDLLEIKEVVLGEIRRGLERISGENAEGCIKLRKV